MDWRKHISTDPAICHGKACIRDTRIMASAVLDNLAAGKSPDEVLQLYPTLRREDVTAVVAYAAELAGERDRDEAARRLGQAFGKLDALNDPPMSPEEVQTEIEGARAERRAWMQRAAPKDSAPDDR